jgi:hypothetical protein
MSGTFAVVDRRTFLKAAGGLGWRHVQGSDNGERETHS